MNQKQIQAFFNNVMAKLNHHGWKLRFVENSHEGFCWKQTKVIDLGLNSKNPKQLLLHEIAHIETCRFCNNKHTPGFWKYFKDLMFRFLPNENLSESQRKHMSYSFEGIYSLDYSLGKKRSIG